MMSPIGDGPQMGVEGEEEMWYILQEQNHLTGANPLRIMYQ